MICSDNFFRFGREVAEKVFKMNNINKNDIHASRIDGEYIVRVGDDLILYSKLCIYFNLSRIGDVELMISNNINGWEFLKIVDFSSDKWKDIYYLKRNRKLKLKQINGK